LYDGSDFIDHQFEENWRGAADAGLNRGAYHFFPVHPVTCKPGTFSA
jgi:lysozyme